MKTSEWLPLVVILVVVPALVEAATRISDAHQRRRYAKRKR